MFDIEISGQMAAWFLGRSPGKSMSHMKLIKLLYLAERTAIQRMGYPILGDSLVSMPHGPVLSRTLNYMKENKPARNGWTKWVSPVKDNEVALARDYEPKDLDLLSKATLDILVEVWSRFGRMGKWEISDYTHDNDNCPEWKDPGDSSLPISYKQLLRVLGHSEEEAAKIAEELENRRELGGILLS